MKLAAGREGPGVWNRPQLWAGGNVGRPELPARPDHDSRTAENGARATSRAPCRIHERNAWRWAASTKSVRTTQSHYYDLSADRRRVIGEGIPV